MRRTCASHANPGQLISRCAPNRAQTEHVRGGYSRAYAVVLLASSSGIADKRELYAGITVHVEWCVEGDISDGIVAPFKTQNLCRRAW